jgi:hypothetical protein
MFYHFKTVVILSATDSSEAAVSFKLLTDDIIHHQPDMAAYRTDTNHRHGKTDVRCLYGDHLSLGTKK